MDTYTPHRNLAMPLSPEKVRVARCRRHGHLSFAPARPCLHLLPHLGSRTFGTRSSHDPLYFQRRLPPSLAPQRLGSHAAFCSSFVIGNSERNPETSASRQHETSPFARRPIVQKSFFRTTNSSASIKDLKI